MQKIPTYYQGSSIALLIRAKNRDDGTPVTTSGYDLEGVAFTRLVGEKISFSTLAPASTQAEAIDDTTFAVNIPGELTEKLTPGECTLQLTFIDKQTGARYIDVRKLMLVEHTVKI